MCNSRRLLVCLAWIGVVGAIAIPTGGAAEPVESFLQGLEQRGYFELSLKYLDRLENSSLAPPDFQREIDFRRALVELQWARALRNPTLRQQRLATAERLLKKFLREDSGHPAATMARSQLGNVLVEHARGLMVRAGQGGPDQADLQAEAGKVFDSAHALLTQTQEDLAAQLQPLNGLRDRDAAEQREQLRSRYVQAKLAAALVLMERAETSKADASKYNELLSAAAAALGEISQKYRNWSAGLYAVLYEGECFQRLGDHARALSYFAEVAQNTDNSTAVRRLKTKALTLAVASWLDDKQQGHEPAIANASKWLETARGGEKDEDDWRALQLALARAYQQKSVAADNEREASRAIREARDLAEDVARRRGPLQQQARQLLVALGRDDQTPPAPVVPDDTATFAQARDAAKKALDDMKLSQTAVKILQSQYEKLEDPANREAVAARREEAQARTNVLSEQAREWLERAVALAGPEDLNDLNGVRYYLAYLYYANQQYRRAAVLASFVATRYPASAAAPECANVALAAHQHIYRELAPADRLAQSARIAKIAELIMANWPAQSQGATALSTLLDVALVQGDLAAAEAYLARIPVDSPQRAGAELRGGQALWRKYLEDSSPDSANASASNSRTDLPDSAEAGALEKLRTRARELLTAGLAGRGDAAPDETTLRAALLLAQIELDAGDAAAALSLLTHPNYGAMTLLDRGDGLATGIAGFAEDAYKTAIRAQVSTASSADSESSMQAARATLDRLRAQLSDQPAGQEKLITIYVGLARDLQRQLEVAPPETRNSLSAGFETFLRGAAETNDDVAVLNWVAETYYGLGQSLEQAADDAGARRYYTEAASSYQRLLQLAREQPSEVAPKMLLQIQVRLAVALRALGQYQGGLDLLAGVLAKKDKVLDFQIEAARTLQAWGDAGQSQAYVKAIQGDRPDKAGRNMMWGWARLSAVVGRPELLDKSPAYREAFYEARYNIALCRYKYALVAESKRRELLLRAKRDIIVTRQLYPNLENERRGNQYETLLKSIQASLGERPADAANRGK